MSNHRSPVTLSGIAMLVSELQSENADSPMLFTLDGMVYAVSVFTDWVLQ